MAPFPNEILQEIFINIDDIKTLHSIVLVNRNWCRNGIKHLWKNPFRNDVDLKNHIKIVPLLLKFIVKDKEFMKRFIHENYDKFRDYKKELDSEETKENNTDESNEINNDNNYELDYDDEDEELDFDEYDEYDEYEEDYEDYEDYEDSDEYDDDDDSDIERYLPSDASFDYPSFITHINFRSTFLLVMKYVKDKESKANNNLDKADSGEGKRKKEIESVDLDANIPLPDVPEIEQVFGFVFAIMRMIVKRGAMIEEIILKLDEVDVFGKNSEQEQPFSTFHYGFDEKAVEQLIMGLDMFFISIFVIAYQKKNITFKNLRNVELGGCIYKDHILSSLALLSNNVRALEVNDFSISDIQESLTKFLKSQNKLEQIIIKGDTFGYVINRFGSVSGIISNLVEYQASTLKKLKLTNANIGSDSGFESLLKCKQLECLSLVRVNMRLRHITIFNQASFPNLKTLKLDFIDYSAGLRALSINPFIKIMHNCNMVSNLDVLSIKYEGEHNHKLLKGILENCNRNLVSLSIVIIEIQDIPPLFSILKKCINMRKLSLTRSCRMSDFGFTVEMAKFLPKNLVTLEFIHMILSDSSLVGFFDNCKVRLKQFRLNFHGYNQLDRVVYRGLIEKYSKRKKMVVKELGMSSDSDPNLEFNVKWA